MVPVRPFPDGAVSPADRRDADADDPAGPEMSRRIDTTQYTGWRWVGAVIVKGRWWFAFWGLFLAADLWWMLR